jgi:hypothetical protein
MARDFEQMDLPRPTDMWGFDNSGSGGSRGGGRTPQQIWSSMNTRDKRDLTRKVMARRTPSQAQVGLLLLQLTTLWWPGLTIALQLPQHAANSFTKFSTPTALWECGVVCSNAL